MRRQVTAVLAGGAQGSRTCPGQERHGPAPSQNAGPSCLPSNHIPPTPKGPIHAHTLGESGSVCKIHFWFKY